MNFLKLFTLIVIVLLTLVITNMPNFHLDNYVGLNGYNIGDLAFHAFYYFVITFPIIFIFHKKKLSIVYRCLLILVPAILEFSQALIPGRSVSASDLLGNYLGVAIALLICYLSQYFVRYVKNKKAQHL